jgi:hypothetical protein
VRLVDGGKFWPARPLPTCRRRQGRDSRHTRARAGLVFPSLGNCAAKFSKPWKNRRRLFPMLGKFFTSISKLWKNARTGRVHCVSRCVLRTDGGGQGHARTRSGTCCARRSLRRRRVMALARHSAALRYGATGLRRLRLDGREFYATRRHGYAAALQPCGWLHRIKSSSANSADPRRPSARLPLRSKLGPFAPRVPRDWRQ